MANKKKVLGLILELNPPHYGHKYFIDQAKEIVCPDYTICTLSTSFCMRGTPSCIDKWQKAQIALKLGVDYVFELPSAYYLQSADAFCRESIKILAKLDVTDIAFGVELDNLSKLEKIVDIMDSDVYNANLRDFLDKGSSYSSASLKALIECTNDEEIINNFALPNNTLAICYLKELRNYPHINIHLVKRIDNNYYDEKLGDSLISSATSIRNAINNNDNYISRVIDKDYHYLKEAILNEGLYALLKYQFATHDLAYFNEIIGVSEGIQSRIAKFIADKNTLEELANNVQTKRYSLNHVNRALINIILDNKKIEEESYLRLLAFKKDKKDYLNKLDKKIKELIFSSPKDKQSIILDYELRASKIFDIISGLNTYIDEYKAPIVLGSEQDE